MPISELIPEYIKTEKALEKRLCELKELYRHTQGANAPEIQKRIDVMTDELNDVRHVISYLIMNYTEQDIQGVNAYDDGTPQEAQAV